MGGLLEDAVNRAYKYEAIIRFDSFDTNCFESMAKMAGKYHDHCSKNNTSVLRHAEFDKDNPRFYLKIQESS